MSKSDNDLILTIIAMYALIVYGPCSVLHKAVRSANRIISTRFKTKENNNDGHVNL